MSFRWIVGGSVWGSWCKECWRDTSIASGGMLSWDSWDGVMGMDRGDGGGDVS